jgi:hypothetical protein
MSRRRRKPEPGNVYDQASRFLMHLDALPLLLWLLGTTRARIDFVQWVDTRRLVWPGQPDRTCDTVAWVVDRADGSRPWAVVVEFQAEADPEMFGRLLQYLGAVWLDARPSTLPGDRFFVGAVVVNLTGTGQASQHMELADTEVLVHLGVRERNLAALSADDLLDQVEAKQAPRLALAWLPVMHHGGDSGRIKRWLKLADRETDKNRRQALGLAQVFAEKAGCGPAWEKALKGWDVMESPIVKRWTAQARAEGEARGEARGEAKGKAEALVQVLEERFEEVPADLRAALAGQKDARRLKEWLSLALTERSLRLFRQKAGL